MTKGIVCVRVYERLRTMLRCVKSPAAEIYKGHTQAHTHKHIHIHTYTQAHRHKHIYTSTYTQAHTHKHI